MSELESRRQTLLQWFAELPACAVAMSAGVDSAVVAKAAHVALGPRAVAVTGVSPSLAAAELDEACRVAELIGIRHEQIETAEFDKPEYLRNGPDRCFHCKTELYTRLQELARRLNVPVIVNGANLDDAGDYRPGLKAAADFRVRSPLMECGIDKATVRALAQAWSLPVWDKPASPCLSSRVAYGEEVTPERLAMVERGERWLREAGFQPVRVRYHGGDLARVEVPLEQLPRLTDDALRAGMVEAFRQFGFRFITLDVEGFRSGSLNALVPVSQLRAGLR